ncbi:MAG: DUF362 domain-containing protein [Desulfohalobiaceae bacterium]
MNYVSQVEYTSYAQSVTQVLEELQASKALAGQERVLLKPNLINDSAFPVTTHQEFCAAVIDYVRSCCDCELIIAEGCGDPGLETWEVFQALGYTRLCSSFNVQLLDLNQEQELLRLENPDCELLPEVYLPRIAFDSYIISLPVLKAHSLARITGSLKNMLGFAPPKYYSGQHGSWKKAFFHANMQKSLQELNSYLLPDLSLMDASLGLAKQHLGGPVCSPKVNRILGSYDAYSLDQKAAGLLGMDPKDIKHLWPLN